MGLIGTTRADHSISAASDHLKVGIVASNLTLYPRVFGDCVILFESKPCDGPIPRSAGLN